MRTLTMICLTIAMLANVAVLRAETVKVPGRSPIKLDLFSCNDVRHGKLIRRVCYEGASDYLLVLVGKQYVHYCSVDDETVHKFLDSANKDRYYDRFIKKHFSCRGKKLPT